LAKETVHFAESTLSARDAGIILNVTESKRIRSFAGNLQDPASKGVAMRSLSLH